MIRTGSLFTQILSLFNVQVFSEGKHRGAGSRLCGYRRLQVCDEGSEWIEFDCRNQAGRSGLAG
ncbi:MAG: hypothetical protein JWQ71_551 [Pedosphaera sp.]|nr:hypothetical protein [Pedosphaera sp.]